MSNRLAQAASPYLLQHKDNPVAWQEWGDEAFAEARRRDVPVFLSIGYATCHWCHVMAHETFEDKEVARLMNDAFVCIKVDREERPDVDSAYMAVCQAMTGSGGWPLNVVMAPDKRPFFAGTYFPKHSHPNRIGMLDLVPKLKDAWRNRRRELEHSADHVIQHLAEAPPSDGPQPSLAWLDAAAAGLKARYDGANGGFGDRPKFPSPHQLRFLLRQHRRTGDGDALHMAVHTLDAMAAGGIHDHVGGGFHRYATDAAWLLPHFEKMLYDQATLMLAYTEAYHATGEPRFAAVVRGIATYLERDLQHPDGAFYCAEDADSEGEEGRFYVWSLKELQGALGDDAALFIRAYGVTAEGNYLDEATRQRTGANVLHLPRPLAALARDEGLEPADLDARLEACRGRLLKLRSKRTRPLLDDKVLTDWNGLIIAALARAGTVLGHTRMVGMAEAAARFIITHLRGSDGTLRHRYRAGAVDDNAFLDDHAFLAWGLLELFEATQDPAWLVEARAVVDPLLERFQGQGGALRLTPRGAEALPVQRRDAYDGALPSGNSVAIGVLERLGRITGNQRFTDAAHRIVGAFAADMARHPIGFTEALCNLEALLTGGMEVVVAGNEGGPQSLRGAAAAESLLGVARAVYRPDAVLLRRTDAMAAALPWLVDYGVVGGKPAAYVCRARACQKPVTDAAALTAALRSTSAP